MNISIFIGLLFSLQIFYWLVGQRASKNIKNQEDYFLAGKSVRFFPLMMTFLATQVGGGIALGSADEAYLFGWPVIFYPLGAALGLIALGCGIGRKLAGFNVSTVAQLFEVVYGSEFLKKIASLLSILSLFMVLVAQIIASHKFLVMLGMTHVPLFILFWAIVIFYTSQGGLKAVISTDVVQAAFFSIIFIACIAWVLIFEPSLSFLQMPSEVNFANVSSKLWGWLLMPLLFMVIEQDMAQRCFAGSSPNVVSKAALFAGLSTIVVCIVPVFFGTVAKAKGIEIPQGGSVLIAAIAQMTNPWITALAGCAILAAIISTATSLINAISSNLLNDFRFSSPRDNRQMNIAKWMTCGVSIAAIFFAFYFDSIVDLLIQSYELSVSCLFVSVFIALFKKQGNYLSAYFSIFFGIVGFFLFRIHPIEFPKEIASIFLSIFGFGFGEVLTFSLSKEARKIA